MKLLLGLMLLMGASETWAQAEVIRLQCDGNYSDFSTDIRNVESRGDFVEIKKDTVRLVDFVMFAGPKGVTYRITDSNETRIAFMLPTNTSYGGTLNRLSGNISLSVQDPINENKLRAIYSGVCRPAKPLF